MNRPASELLYDSEAALRLVATALQELQGSRELPNASAHAQPNRESAIGNRESGIGKAGNGKGETGKVIAP